MTKMFEKIAITPEQIFNQSLKLGANQLTFRILYSVDNPKNGDERKINEWIHDWKCSDSYMNEIRDFIKTDGKPLERLSFGAIRYSVNGISYKRLLIYHPNFLVGSYTRFQTSYGNRHCC